ncbi:hypothetical protein SLEP1_g16870 [Rubroshorea leprosula]|uniref:Uncharacterized protein n=1 Tax=Rubroshorea leprosula TaxID=152421 RepID=A0AAV5J153_9ROSI|nr:hypothetical protein SLEP1_g16870 [Rubroshorea leprosula]
MELECTSERPFAKALTRFRVTVPAPTRHSDEAFPTQTQPDPADVRRIASSPSLHPVSNTHMHVSILELPGIQLTTAKPQSRT